MDDGGGQIRVVLKPKQKRRSSGSAPGAMPVIPPEADDSPSIPLKQLRKSEPEAMPVRPVPVSGAGNDLPELKPSAERKKNEAEREEDLREMEALQKIRELERMSPPERSPFLPGKKMGCFLIFLVGIFVMLFLYSSTLDKGVRTISEIKKPDGKLAKILPQNNELFQELIQDPPPAAEPPPPPPQAPEKKEEASPQKPPGEIALDTLRKLLEKKAPSAEIAVLLHSFQNEFIRSESLHESVVRLLLKTPYAEICRKEYARWAKENPESALPNRLCGLELFRGRRAVPYLERAVAAEPNHRASYKRLVEEYCNAGSYLRAAAVCSNYLKIYPDDAGVWTQKAMILIDSGDSPERVIGDLKKALSEHCGTLTGSQRAAKLLPLLLRTGEFQEAVKLLAVVKRDPALRDSWQQMELVRALSTATPADPDALKSGVSVLGDRMLILYDVSNRNFPDLEKRIADGLPVQQDFWWIFAQWYCRSNDWKAELPQLLRIHGESLFRTAMLRFWSGNLSLGEARELLERVPPREKNIMAFLLALAAERQGNTIAEKVLLHTVGKTLLSGIYSTLFQRYITAPSDTAPKKEIDR